MCKCGWGSVGSPVPRNLVLPVSAPSLMGNNFNYQIVAKEGFSLLYFESQSSHS